MTLTLLAEKYRNKPFVLPDDLAGSAGEGLWCEKWTGSNLFQGPTFAGLETRAILDGMAARNIRLLQVHDSDVDISLKSSTSEIQEIAGILAELCVERGISVEGVTCNLFSHPCFAGGATTSLSEHVWMAALAKALKTVDLAAAINKAIEGMGAEADCIPLKRVREIIGWPGGEEADATAKSFPWALNQRIRHIANLAAYAVETGVATPENKLLISEEPKPWEPARQIVVGTTGHALAMMLTLEKRITNEIMKAIILAVNPEVAHEDMAFEVYWQAYELAASLGMLACIHLNGSQARGVQDLDLAALRRQCFNIEFALRNYPYVPRILDVKPDRTDLDLVQRWRVTDESFRSLVWARQAVKFVTADSTVKEIIDALGQCAPVGMMSPIDMLTADQRNTLANKVFDGGEIADLQNEASSAGNLCFALEHRIDELLHKEF